MNPFLEELFNVIAIDIEYLNGYLTSSEMDYLNTTFKSIEDLNSDFYTDEQGLNLEALLFFLFRHSKDITSIWEDRSKKEVLVALYTSVTISGNYDCFHFDLSKFELTFEPSGQELTLYRIGRVSEVIESLGNSWAKDGSGLRIYAESSSIDIGTRPIFEVKVNDSEVLCQGKSQESELILKKNFKCNEVKLLNVEERHTLLIN
ncbi:hypothetical protein [Thiomicrorhabdus lithotrophica]|uniref:Uncharacterized protein n=1 Tax=Thiomicrorhabdus lithotrophica TaxID=2949997 RepID=A0ABY8CCC3_9GAMM|nr:hypothetical protein [Thiomicrorhabdus lithotrophica]WEJ63655.1 hypothetical protein NR989_05205 [Thiomicrorhabdus lithotrophica]